MDYKDVVAIINELIAIRQLLEKLVQETKEASKLKYESE